MIVSSAFPPASRTPLRTVSSSTAPRKCSVTLSCLNETFIHRTAFFLFTWIRPHSPAFSIRLAAHGIEWRPPLTGGSWRSRHGARTCRQHRSENCEGALIQTLEVDSAVFEPSVNNLTGFGAVRFVPMISASVQNRIRAYYCQAVDSVTLLVWAVRTVQLFAL